jgi:hypothetical protein
MFGKRKQRPDQRKKQQSETDERVAQVRYHDDPQSDYGNDENEEAAAAVLWAMEDEAAHRWDQDEEVDYSKMQEKAAPAKRAAQISSVFSLPLNNFTFK